MELPKVYFTVLNYIGYFIEQKTDRQIWGSAVLMMSSHSRETTGHRALCWLDMMGFRGLRLLSNSEVLQGHCQSPYRHL